MQLTTRRGYKTIYGAYNTWHDRYSPQPLPYSPFFFFTATNTIDKSNVGEQGEGEGENTKCEQEAFNFYNYDDDDVFAQNGLQSAHYGVN